MRLVSLALVLFGFWLLLSGHYTSFLISLGFLTAIGCVALSWRMGIVDVEGHPIELARGAISYVPWLIGEIAKSTWDVVKIVLNPSLPISPRMIKVQASQQTRVGVAVFCNSITLTPGTITVDVKDHDLTVHALTAEGAEDLLSGDMDARVTQFEGEE